MVEIIARLGVVKISSEEVPHKKKISARLGVVKIASKEYLTRRTSSSKEETHMKNASSYHNRLYMFVIKPQRKSSSHL